MGKIEKIIRLAGEKDFSFLPEIEKEAGRAFEKVGLAEIAAMDPAPASFYGDVFAKGGAVFIAEAEGKLLGFAVVLPLGDMAYLKEISVRLEVAGKGFGSALLQAVEAWAFEAGFSEVGLTTFKDVPFNAPFYVRRGYAVYRPKAGGDMARIRDAEREEGLEIRERVAMRKKLGFPSFA